jgi:hypothetical protein
VLTGFLVARAQHRAQLALNREFRERRAALAENERLVGELQEALASVKTLKGLLPVCAWCRRIRNDQGH